MLLGVGASTSTASLDNGGHAGLPTLEITSEGLAAVVEDGLMFEGKQHGHLSLRFLRLGKQLVHPVLEFMTRYLCGKTFRGQVIHVICVLHSRGEPGG